MATAGAAIPPYSLVGSYTLPSGSIDILPDGRLVSISASGIIQVQDSVNASSYSALGSIDPTIFDGPYGNFGPSFIRLSPSATTLAIGDNGAHNRVHFLQLSSLSTSSTSLTTFLSAPNTDGVWRSDSSLFVTGSSSSSVLTRLDLPGSGQGGSAGTSTVVIDNIGDFSGSVAIHNNRLYTGIGYDADPISGGDTTGLINSFDLTSLDTAISPISFLSGLFAADSLSASSLDFDPAGNILVGGGDFFGPSGDFGHAAVVDLMDPSHPLKLSPAGAGAFYSIRFNYSTNELLVLDGITAYRYAIPTAPTTAALILSSLILSRRRRGI